MAKYYNIIKQRIRPIIYASLLALAAGYTNASSYENNRYSFSEFGKIKDIEFGNPVAPIDIETGDLDNDGDLDIIIGSSKGDVYILENRLNKRIK